MLLGYARGKVGSLVFSRSNGQQITRMRASKVKNPQTDAQVIQRIILNTVAQAYSALQPICDHSFEGIKKGQDSMSYFMRNNIGAIRAAVAEVINGANPDLTKVYDFAALGTSRLAINEYTIAKGSLPAMPVIDAGGDLPDAELPDSIKFMLGINYGVSMPDFTSVTYQNICDALGLQRGDQLTFVAIVQKADGQNRAEWMRVILDPKEADGTDAPMTTPFSLTKAETVTPIAINKPNPANVLNDSLQLAGSDAQYNSATTTGLLPFATDGFVKSFAVIASRQKADGTWMRSNAVMTPIWSGYWTNGNTQGKSLGDALSDFKTKGINLGSEWYLNNATD